MKWIWIWLLVGSVACAAERVVINEIYFDPAEKQPLEFVELHNAGDAAVELGGWRLDKFRFEEGTEIAAGGYVVVAQDPVAFEKHFGKRALGPLPGRLSNEGERLELIDGKGRAVENVSYGIGFPWPSSTAGGGASLERIHPALDASIPGHWRASGTRPPSRAGKPLIAAGSTWRWQKGEREASNPPTAWRAPEFADAGWPKGKAGFGYGDDDDATMLDDMRGRYGCVFLRHTFTAPTPRPSTLQLRVRVDDGCIVWLNGREIARLHMPAGEPTIQLLAQDHEAGDWEDVIIESAGDLLVDGPNVLAVQAFNSARDSSDFSIDVILQTPDGGSVGKRPTPGARNTVYAEITPPAARQVRHFPAMPKPNETVKITAEFSRGAPAATVTVAVQVVEPGAYVRKSDPDYAERWEEIAMRDDGQGGDAKAGDQMWTATLGADVQRNRRLIRYRITAADRDGAAVGLPYADDPVPNFAYYVWSGAPAWTGAVRPGKTPDLTFSGDFLKTLPTFTLLANAKDVAGSQWDGGYNHRKLPGTLIYDGRVYDHMEFKNRGSASTYVTGKNKWGFHFPRGHDLAMRDPWGLAYERPWNSFAMNACASPWVQINRGMAGLDEAVSFRCYQIAGLPASDTVPIHFRVVTSAEEQGSTQYEGDLWGLYLIVEDVDRAFLENHGWPDGIIASHEKGIKRTPSELEGDPSAMWQEFSQGPKGDAEKWWRSRMDMPSYYSFQAITRLVGNVDLRPGANHHFYRHPSRGWMPVPWDLDMQFIPRHHQPGYIAEVRSLEVPALRLEYKNRAREILDLLASDARPDGGQIGQVVAEYARRIEPSPKPDTSWAMLDAAMWNLHPRSASKDIFFVPETSQHMMGGAFTRKLASADFAGFCRYVIEYCTDSRPEKDFAPNDGKWRGYGWGYLHHEASDKDIPERPKIRYTGAPGFPKQALTFAVSPFADPQGAESFAAVQWRLAAVGQQGNAPWSYELTPLWQGPELAAATAEMRIPGAACRAGVTHRVRARYKDKTGRWSHWSEAVEWVAR